MSNETNMTPDTTGATGGEKCWHVAGCKNHPDRTDLSCFGVRQADGSPVPRTKENLTLMAAAPELYDALVAARKYVQLGQESEFPGGPAEEILDQIDSALAKAKGGDGE